MIIRPAEPRDLKAIVDLHNTVIVEGATAHGAPFELESRRDWLEQRAPDRPLVVAESAGAIVGWGEFSDYRSGRRALARTAELSYHVHPDHRRKGIATALITHLMERAPGLGIHVVIAILLATNTASVAVLERLGFARWGELPEVAELDGVAIDHLYYGRRLGG